jgi:beta-cyclopiazonate dehydrogenase
MGHTSFGLGGLLSFALLNSPFLHAQATPDVITRDVVIVGGGASGTYAGVRLKEMGKTFSLIERNSLLGGHGETFYTNDDKPINYGVEGYFNNSVTLDYLAKLQVPYELRVPAPAEDDYINLRTGKKVDAPEASKNQSAALHQWMDSISQFKFLEDGSYNFPDPVPEDLLLPLRDFIAKYKLDDAVWGVFSHGSGNILDMATLYVIQYIGVPHAKAFLNGYIRPSHGIADLYTRATKVIGSDVIFNSQISRVDRSGDGVKVVVRSSDGKTQRIHAKKLLVTIPPTTRHLTGFSLDNRESSLFTKWHYQSYYAALINETGIPDGHNLINIDPSNPFSVPYEPFIWRVDAQRVPGYHTIKLVGNEQFSEKDARELLESSIERLGQVGTFPATKPRIVKWGDHTPVTMSASAEDIRAGFYKNLYALQGHQSTFYTGASWCSDYSTLLWGFTEDVLKKMFA